MSEEDEELTKVLKSMRALQVRTGGEKPRTRGVTINDPKSEIEGSESGTLTPPSGGGRSIGETRRRLDTKLSSKKFKIILIPREAGSYDEMCKSVIGNGTTFCTKANCQVTHRGPKAAIYPGALVVVKSAGVAFSDPTVQRQKLDEELWDDLKDQSLDMDSWVERFNLIDASEVIVTKASYELSETNSSASNIMKTPGKRVKQEKEILPHVDLSPYKKFLIDNVTPYVEGEETLPGSKVALAISTFEDTFEKVTSHLWSLSKIHEDTANLTADHIKTLFDKVNGITAQVGKRPADLPRDYEAPTVWGTLGILCQATEEGVARNKTEVRDIVGKTLEVEFRKKEAKIHEHVEGKVLDLDSRITKVKDFSKQGISLLIGMFNAEQQAVSDLEEDVKDLKGKRSSSGSTSVGAASSTHNARLSDDRYDELKARIDTIVSADDKTCVKFAGLGLKDYMEVSAWLNKEWPACAYGMIVDAHVVMEQVHERLNQRDVIDKLTKIYKIQIKDIDDARSIGSFETNVPKYFNKTGEYKVITSDMSFFNSIPKHKDWKQPGSGYRDKLKETMESFRIAHNMKIRDTMNPSSRIYGVATEALTNSCSWIEGLIGFIDETYEELSSARFGTTKAWHLTTRLAKRILEDVSRPRQCVTGSLTAGGNREVCPKVFHAVIQAHDVMAHYKELNFRDHPSVSSEFVKFLSTNTGIDSIEQLEVKTSSMEENLKGVSKDVKGAVTTSATASNKIDELKRIVQALEKRVQKLEK